MYYAEAALNSAVAAVKGTDAWRTMPYSDAAAMTAMNTNYDTLDPRPAGDLPGLRRRAVVTPARRPGTRTGTPRSGCSRHHLQRKTTRCARWWPR